jgi:hypothetical protein
LKAHINTSISLLKSQYRGSLWLRMSGTITQSWLFILIV